MKRSSKPSRIYRYGAKAPRENAALVDEQIRLARVYKNALIDLELKRRQQCEKVLKRLHPKLKRQEKLIAGVDAEIDKIRAKLASQNAVLRTKTATRADKEQVKALKQRRKQYYVVLKAMRVAAWAELRTQEMMANIEERHKDAWKELRAQSGLYWGTYLVMEKAAEANRKGPPPRFRRWDGSGKVAVQIQKGMTVEEAMAGDDTRHQLAMIDTRHGLTLLRVGSNGREPVWASVPFTMHRPIPEDARIKWIYLERRKIGTKMDWSLQFVLEREAGWDTGDNATTGAVGIDVGWRLMGDDGLRVAYWVGSDGREGQLLIPAKDMMRWQQAEELQSLIDHNFNGMKDVLLSWMVGTFDRPAWLGSQADYLATRAEAAARTAGKERDAKRLVEEYAAYQTLLHGWPAAAALPDWWAEKTEHLSQWRSPARLASLERHWRANRFHGDELMYQVLRWWRIRYEHLYNWLAHQRRKAAAWRDHLYRNFAREMAVNYQTVCLEKINWRQMMERPQAEEDSDGAMRRHYRIASSGRLQQCLKEAASRHILGDPKHTTQRCYVCGSVEKFDQACLYHTCSACGAYWDQDQNAACNLLSLASGEVAAKPQDSLDSQKVVCP